jgi:TatD DNase family protein
MIIDSHAHITSDSLYNDVDNLVIRAKAVSLEYIVNICTDQHTAKRGMEVTKKYPFIVNVGATTPHDVKELGESDFGFFEKLALEGKLVAIGETGLDYFYEHSDKELQKKYLLKYFDLAKRVNLPVVIHCRDAFEDLFSLADKYYKSSRLLLHCFTGGLDEVKEALKRGYMISLSGIVTFKKSLELQKVAKEIPLENLIIETDSPYLAPQSKRGKQNEPSFIVETAKFLSECKGIDFHEFCHVTTENTKRFFSLK